VIGYNFYSKSPEKIIITKSEDNNSVSPGENSMYKTSRMLFEKTGKPVVVSEGGPGDGVDDCSDYAMQYVDIMSFGFSGLAGFNTWIGWYFGHEVILPSLITTNDFMNREEVRNVLENEDGNWSQGRQSEKHYGRDKKKSKELQYYLSADGYTSVGYVRNRTYNFHSARTSDVCYDSTMQAPLDQLRDIAWDEGTRELYVEGLVKRRNYQVEWYDFRTGEKLLTQCQRGKAKFILKYPDMTVTDKNALHPVMWFIIREDCRD
jgi:hypothetical protein